MKPRSLLFSALAILVPGCAGTPGTPPPVRSSAAVQVETAMVSLRITIPQRVLRTSYVSPSTVKVGIKIGTGTEQIFTVSGPSPYTIKLSMPLGVQTVTTNLYAGNNALLATGTNTLTVAKGKVNSFPGPV